MSYSTPQEVRAAAFPNGGTVNPPDELTGTAADLPNVAITDAIAEADATIDSYLSGAYVIPVALDPTTNTVPHPIDWWSRNIALYLATLTYRGSQDLADQDPVVRRYNATIEALTAVQAGKASLPGNIPEIGSASGSGAATGAGEPFNQYPNALFGEFEFDIPGAVQGPVTVNVLDSPWIR